MTRRKGPSETIDFLSTVERAMRVLEDLADEREGLSVSELARRLDTNKSIVLRILATMETLGYLYRTKDTQRYRLTYRIANLALRQLARSGLIDQCVPTLQDLAERTGEHVRLAVIEGNRPVWIHAVSGLQRQLRVDPIYGHEVILHAHATGKAWLLTLDDNELDRILGNTRIFTTHTKHTLTTARALRADLERARAHGFAISYEEMEIGVAAVAAPILVEDIESKRLCVGVISLAAPTSRMDRAVMMQCGDLVIEAARRVARTWPLGLPTQGVKDLKSQSVG